MRPTTVGVLLVIMVTIGSWSQGKFLGVKHAMAAGVFVVLLTILFQIDRKLGEAMSILALVAVGWIYAVPLVANIKKAPGPIAPNPNSAGQNPPFLSPNIPNQQKQDDWRDFMLPGWR